MLVTCENCKSRFNLDDNLVKESGSKVRCSNCQNIFTVFRPDPGEVAGPDVGLEGRVDAIDTSDESAEEPLDFDLFESEEDEDDEGLSLEDFGLEEDLTAETGQADGQEQQAEETEEEITAEELGFGQDGADAGGAEPVPDVSGDEPAQEGMSIQGLDLEEEPSTKVALSADDDAIAAEQIEEDDISFDDLTLDEDPVVEEVAGLDDPQAIEQNQEDMSFDDLDLEEEADVEQTEMGAEDLSFDDLSLEEEMSDEDLSEHAAGATGDSQDADASMQEGVPVASWEDGEEPEAEAMVDDLPPAEMIDQPASKRGISMPLLICLVVVLLGGGAYAALTFLQGDGMKLPFLESLAGHGQTEAPDTGNLHIGLLDNDIHGGFVESKTAGRLFVVKGKIKSSYPDARNFIRMKGVLYFKDGKIAKDRIVYCGNVLSDAELQTMEWDSIQKRLGNRFGDNKSNFRVPSGKELPFMVVFSELPEDLGEFSVEVVDSVSG